MERGEDDITAGELEELFGLEALYPERERQPRSLVWLIRRTAGDYTTQRCRETSCTPGLGEGALDDELDGAADAGDDDSDGDGADWSGP